jgi:hypothetical protein
MRKMRAPKLSSNRSVSELEAHRTLRTHTRNGARETSDRAQASEQAQRAKQRRIAVLSEFFGEIRGRYVPVGGGIQLAVTPRGAVATQGARLNEETA